MEVGLHRHDRDTDLPWLTNEGRRQGVLKLEMTWQPELLPFHKGVGAVPLALDFVLHNLKSTILDCNFDNPTNNYQRAP